MQRYKPVSMAMASLAVIATLAGCSKNEVPAPKAATESPFRLTGSFKDIMLGEINPAAENLWNAVSTQTDETGIHEKRPQTDEDWLALRHQAIILTEATNLLLMEGRPILGTHQGVKDEGLPGINGPDEIQHTIDSDRATFVKLVHALQDAGAVALQAIDKKDVEALSDAGAGIDTACENCHLKYWYPSSDQAKAKPAE